MYFISVAENNTNVENWHCEQGDYSKYAQKCGSWLGTGNRV
jgi:hypothetical protein